MKFHEVIADKPYFSLLEDIFNTAIEGIDRRVRLMEEVIGCRLFDFFVVEKINERLDGIYKKDAAAAEICRWIMEGHLPCFDQDEAIKAFREVLASLTDKEREVIQMLYLDSKDRVTLKAVAIKLGVSPERVRQIKAKTFRKLRHPSRFKKLEAVFRSARERYEIERNRADELARHNAALATRLEQTIGAIRQIPFVAELLETKPFFIPDEDVIRPEEKLERLLATSIDELELSIRSYGCLKNNMIYTVRDLVTKSEHELLKNKSFGRKSLWEIKELLSGMNLSLGMRLE